MNNSKHDHLFVKNPVEDEIGVAQQWNAANAGTLSNFLEAVWKLPQSLGDLLNSSVEALRGAYIFLGEVRKNIFQLR